MMSKDDLAKIKEERDVMESWRKVSCHVVADLCEACSICGTVRDKDRLAHCRWCEDVCRTTGPHLQILGPDHRSVACHVVVGEGR